MMELALLMAHGSDLLASVNRGISPAITLLAMIVAASALAEKSL